MGINPAAMLLGRLQGKQMNQGFNQMSAIAQAMTNPQAAMEQMILNDPRIKNVMDLIAQNGGDGEALFYQKARELGKDPQAILDEAHKGYDNFMNQFNSRY